jgi:hypothetical protein
VYPSTNTFSGTYTGAVASSNLVSVVWKYSVLVSNMCGTGTSYVVNVVLDKNNSKNAAFFASYPVASSQKMKVTLVCPSSPVATQTTSENYYTGGTSTTINMTYPSGCYVDSFAATSIPACYIP